jgi:hypothetical protein
MSIPQGFYEQYQAIHHFSMDPVFDSVAALYLYDSMEDTEDGVRAEVSDSVVMMDFQELAWIRSNNKSGEMRGWWKDLRKFAPSRNLSVTKTCVHCGASYHPPYGTEKRSKLCGIACRADAQRSIPLLAKP